MGRLEQERILIFKEVLPGSRKHLSEYFRLLIEIIFFDRYNRIVQSKRVSICRQSG